MSSYIVIKKEETESAYISMCSDGIIRVLFKRDKEISPSVLKPLFEKINEMVQGVSYPFIYFAEDGSVVFTTEGNTYSKQNQHVFPKICNAFVTKSLSQRLIANFYLKINKPSYPSKLFKNQYEAEEWCFQQLEIANQKHQSSVM
ncbi:MAG TPA: hypothetical protein PKZ75_02275 [Bacteroidia bacterium]|nr:hypothetical protein [Bacteroidia bacterium]